MTNKFFDGFINLGYFDNRYIVGRKRFTVNKYLRNGVHKNQYFTVQRSSRKYNLNIQPTIRCYNTYFPNSYNNYLHHFYPLYYSAAAINRSFTRNFQFSDPTIVKTSLKENSSDVFLAQWSKRFRNLYDFRTSQ